MLSCHKNECSPVSYNLVIKWMQSGLMLACLKKWMSTGLMLACYKHGCSPVSYNLVIKMDAVLSHTILP